MDKHTIVRDDASGEWRVMCGELIESTHDTLKEAEAYLHDTDELTARAMEYAHDALAEVTTFPADYGIDAPWRSVDEWVAFELAGDAGDTFKTREERAAIEAALHHVATLDALNEPFKDREPPDPPGWEGGFAENH